MYTYDDSGNITRIADASGNTLRAYTYSRLTGQLLSEENAATGTKTTYQYGDYNGNLLSKTITPLAGGTASTISYAYGNTTGWKDQLTAYNGDAITYDASGNPLTYRNGMTMTWQGGRELTTATNNGTSIAYSYNKNSIRTKKTVGGVTTQYYLNGDTMVAEKKGGNLITYMFDETGERFGFLYNNTPYFYVRNMQGDVIRILNLFGSVLAQYEYDAWGKVLSVTDSDGDAITGATHIGNINPIRYRGYYYDTETGFYYLQSRYYDPEIGRFINADEPEMAKFSTKELLAKDLFAYCNNNPINFFDPTGYYAATLVLSASITTSLGSALSGIMASISASIAGIKAAIASSWFIPACIIATTVAIAGIVYAVNKVKKLAATASTVLQAVKARVKAGGINPKTIKQYTVYVITRKGTSDVVYVGITKRYSSRKSAHKKRFPSNKFTMFPLKTGLSRAEARAMEQTLISAYTLDTLKNMINSISPKKWSNFKNEFEQMNTLILSWLDPE